MAKAVTNHVQQNGFNVNNATQNGTLHVDTAFYVVRWPWIVLPLLEAVLAAVLLLITIVLNKQPLLKTLYVRLLAHGPENAVDYRVGDVETSEKWDKFGDGITVMLLADEKRWTRLTPT